MRYTDIDRQIEALAGKQFGAFSREQAFKIGASERFVKRRLTERHWLRPVNAVYVIATSAGTWKRQCKIAELSVHGAAVAGRSALALHEASGFKPGPIELLGPVNASRVHPFATVHRYAGAKLTVVDGIRVTTIPQSLFDVASRVSPWNLERAMDDAILGKRLDINDLKERLDFYVGSRRPGLPRIRPLVLERLEDGWTPPESELEALLIDVLTRLPTNPMIVRQATFPWRDAKPGRVDILLPAHKLIIEADGRRWHARLKDFDRDRWRDNEAVAHGHRVMRFTWVHLNHLADDAVTLVNQACTGSAWAVS